MAIFLPEELPHRTQLPGADGSVAERESGRQHPFTGDRELFPPALDGRISGLPLGLGDLRFEFGLAPRHGPIIQARVNGVQMTGVPAADRDILKF